MRLEIDSQNLACIFTFPDMTEHKATAQLFTHRYDGRLFWYGVAQFAEVPIALPGELNGGKVTFDDGRSGGVSFNNGTCRSGGYFEVDFVGVSKLEHAK